jgi:stage II sporulation protein D
MRYGKAIVLGLYLLICSGFISAADIRVGLFYGRDIRSIVFSVIDGEYILSGDGHKIAVIRKGTMFHIGLTGAGLAVNDTLRSYGVFHRLDFTGVSSDNVFQVKPVFPSLPAKESDDNLSTTVSDQGIQLINILDLEKYIPGTVEAEGGSTAANEFYKAQAVLSRTYAVKNFTRHASEGFNLCDGVHCQAFNGKSRWNRIIYGAANETRNNILVDGNGDPIITAYHANCGGVTSSASMAWNKDLPYLVGIKDPFCDGSPRHNWSKTLTVDEWNKYLKGKGIKSTDIGAGMNIDSRQKYWLYGSVRLSLTTIRQDLALRSSFFTLSSDQGTVTISGHGYGHGVGMCQEGAMEMARVGYNYLDILMFYFHGVRLSNR